MSDDLVTIEIDGKPLKAKKGAMVIQVADDADIYIPRFCYHEKLSVAANCRMCLVEVEKAPKPMPACATPVAEGMKVFTDSPKAVSAQKAVMEFLLINHPLDCPVCDQGGECELQDLAMGYGSDVSRYTERKRIIKDENIGPLISTDMTRCIHCTRCVRFGTEIAGIQELGAVGRGENMRIRTFIERSVDHELSGNVIDLCPVGALNSRPFRMRGRSWEMINHPLVSPHDAAGSNLFGHVLRGKYVRTVPRTNEAVNETWISDRDRFGYEGVHSGERLAKPLVKENGAWREVNWEEALEKAAKAIKDVDANDLGILLSPSSTVEEFFLARRIADHLGARNIDHRVRQADFIADGEASFPSLGRSIASLENLDAVLVVGSSLRKDVPIVAHRIRKAAMKGAKVSFVNPRKYDFLFPVANESIVAYDEMAVSLAGVAQALAKKSGKTLPANLKKLLAGVKASEAMQNAAQQLLDGTECAVILGDLAESHPQFADLKALAAAIAEMSGASFGLLAGGANSAGGWLAGAIPSEDGLNARDMFAKPRKAYLLLGVEPEMDCWDGAETLKALRQADKVVVLTSFVTDTMKAYADVLLPIGTLGETAGSYINAEGTWQSFGGASKPVGEVRPAWKVLRVLGNLLNVADFDYMAPTDVTEAARAAIVERGGEPVANTPAFTHELRQATKREGLLRVAETALYGTDSLVRRASSLQVTADAKRQAAVNISAADAERLGMSEGMYVTVRQGACEAILPVHVDAGVVDGSVFIASGVAATGTLGPRVGIVELAKAEDRK
ncbi:MAG TPA: NADH-quinone oxidoreductase subunit NuoG [Gammaproteobacteria bacterium]